MSALPPILLRAINTLIAKCDEAKEESTHSYMAAGQHLDATFRWAKLRSIAEAKQRGAA
jgi:hypothetical protein